MVVRRAIFLAVLAAAAVPLGGAVAARGEGRAAELRLAQNIEIRPRFGIREQLRYAQLVLRRAVITEARCGGASTGCRARLEVEIEARGTVPAKEFALRWAGEAYRIGFRPVRVLRPLRPGERRTLVLQSDRMPWGRNCGSFFVEPAALAGNRRGRLKRMCFILEPPEILRFLFKDPGPQGARTLVVDYGCPYERRAVCPGDGLVLRPVEGDPRPFRELVFSDRLDLPTLRPGEEREFRRHAAGGPGLYPHGQCYEARWRKSEGYAGGRWVRDRWCVPYPRLEMRFRMPRFHVNSNADPSGSVDMDIEYGIHWGRGSDVVTFKMRVDDGRSYEVPADTARWVRTDVVPESDRGGWYWWIRFTDHDPIGADDVTEEYYRPSYAELLLIAQRRGGHKRWRKRIGGGGDPDIVYEAEMIVTVGGYE